MSDDLADYLVCSQCGNLFTAAACGPTHALIQRDPTQHRIVAALIEQVAAATRAEGVAQGRVEYAKEILAMSEHIKAAHARRGKP